MTTRKLTGLPRIVGEDDSKAPPPSRPAAPAPRLAPSAVAPPARRIRPRDEFVTAWLLLLLDRGATYGYELLGELEAYSVSIDSAVVYRTLRRLEGDGLVTSHWMKSGVGPRRRSYRLTAGGTRQLDEVAGVISSIRDLHDRFLDEHHRTRARDVAAPS